MQAQYHSSPKVCSNSHHNAKRQLLGNPAANIAPAWKLNAQAKEKQKLQEESKILLSKLPADVGDTEVEELFKKTVGPVKEAFIIYNSQGRSKGMSIVTFQRQGDAALAKAKYDGRYIDHKRPIKIEIITDDVPETQARAPPAVPSLLSRLGGIAAIAGSTNLRPGAASALPPMKPQQQKTAVAHSSMLVASMARPRRMRKKKGPRRVRKTAMQLDKEIEDYRAALGAFEIKGDNS